jgi:branched-chain amino acid aminotransferase
MTVSSTAPQAPAVSARDYAKGVAFVGDRFVPAAEATVSVFDHSFLYGDGAFESIVFRNGRCFAFDPHIDRLEDSCRYIKLALPMDKARLREMADELIRRNGLKNGFLRIVVSRGEGYPLSDPRKTIAPLIVATIQGDPPNKKSVDGIRVLIASTRRTSPESLDPRAKLNNYGNHIMAKLEAIGAGVDDAIMLDGNANVAELPGCNLFTISRGEVATPPAGNILMGITRAMVLRILRGGGIKGVVAVSEKNLTPLDLYAADEIFVTGTGTGVAFIAEIDGRRVGEGRAGPLTAQVMAAYQDMIDHC